MERSSESKFKLRFVVLFLSIISCIPLFFIMRSLPSDDILYHWVWHKCFSQQLLAGDLYPRWLVEQNGGLGAPTFHYYGPLAFYISAIISPILSPIMSVPYILAATATLFVVASALLYFRWLNERFSAWPSAIGAVLYAIAPYHLSIDFYKRFAFGELLTFVWMPLVLLGVDRLRKTDRIMSWRSAVEIGVPYGLLILSHPPVTLIFSAIPPLYAFIGNERSIQFKKVVQSLCGMAIGVGLSAFYFLPALLDQSLIRIDSQHKDYFDFHKWFLFPPSAPSRLILTLAAATVLQLLCYFVVFGLSYRNSRANIDRRNWFWILVAVGSCFMMSTLSTFIWELIPMLQKLQFTWRFSALLVLALGPLVADALTQTFEKKWERHTVFSSVVGFALLCIGTTGVTIIYLNGMAKNRPANEIEYNQGKLDNLIVSEEFQPVTAKSLYIWDLKKIDEIFPKEGERRVKAISGDATVTVKKWSPYEILLEVNTTNPALITIRQLLFGTHRAEIVGSPSEVRLEPFSPHGLLSFNAPTGKHLLRIVHVRTTAEKTGLLCSFLSLILLGILKIQKRS